MTFARRHLLDIENLSRSEIESLLADSKTAVSDPHALVGKTVALTFFEASTRTRGSFELAAKRLGATVLALDVATSSTSKGETLVDTLTNLEAMGIDAFVVRHSASGVLHPIVGKLQAAVVNAGDGRHEHPTQALLDALTIQNHKGTLSGLVVTIAGDISNSRVARSNVHLLGKLGSEVRLVAPHTLMPRDAEQLGHHVRLFDRMEAALPGSDVVMMLRVQTERISDAAFPSKAEYFKFFGLTEERLRLAKSDAIVMHPGPMNRGVEIASSVADGPQSVILEQVANGVLVRAAVLRAVIGAR